METGRFVTRLLSKAPGYVVAAALAAVAVGYLPAFGRGGRPESPSDPPGRRSASPPQQRTVEPGEVQAPAELLGVVAPAETVDLLAVGAGRLMRAAAVGERLTAGEPVAELSGDDLDLQRRAQAARVRDAELAVRRLELVLAAAERKAERRDSSPELFSIEQLEESRLHHRSALLELESAGERHAEAAAELALLDQRIARQRLVAPIDGVVAARWVDPGATVSAGQAIARLVSTAPGMVRFAARAGDLGRYRIGAAVEVSAGSGEVVSCAVVEGVSPNLDPGSRFVFVEARLSDRRLEPLPFGSAVRIEPSESGCG